MILKPWFTSNNGHHLFEIPRTGAYGDKHSLSWAATTWHTTPRDQNGQTTSPTDTGLNTKETGDSRSLINSVSRTLQVSKSSLSQEQFRQGGRNTDLSLSIQVSRTRAELEEFHLINRRNCLLYPHLSTTCSSNRTILGVEGWAVYTVWCSGVYTADTRISREKATNTPCRF